MTAFTQIYDEPHDFIDGNITISNTLSNLGKAYVETLVTGLSDSLNRPMLLGFLYQIDVNAKRSKPYPIVSQRQTINLDLSECETFLFIPSNRLIDDYIFRLYLSTESGNGEAVDLSDYALKSELPSLANYVSDSELATALSDYALVSQLPNLSSYVTNSSLATALDDYVLTADLPTDSNSGSQNFIPVSANATLESNKNYLATVSGLIFTLPLSPAIGDVITCATGNFSTKVFQNTSQTILNLSTQTTIGTSNGIILKPYSSIRLICVAADLWITGFRSRTINNWLAPTGSSDVQQTYTASLDSGVNAAYGTVNSIKDGTKTPNYNLSDSLILNASIDQYRNINIALASPKKLSKIRHWAGQGNTGATGNEINSPNEMKVYGGTDTSNLLATFTLSKTRGVGQNLVLSLGTAYQNYVLSFKNSEATSISIMEIELFANEVIGGEVVAV